jgi:uncharacterized protein (TIGR02246 family)
MRLLLTLPLLAFAAQLGAQSTSDEAAVRGILDDEIATWNKGDAVGYSRHFADAGTFTNIRGEFFKGHAPFLKQHAAIFGSFFKNTTVSYEVVSLTFPRPDVAIAETLTSVAGMAPVPPGMMVDAKGRLRTRLLQVLAKDDGVWKIVAYHNVDVKPGIAVPEPR